MAHVNVTHVTVLDNPTSFMNPFQFEICFECFYPIPDGTLPGRARRPDG